MAAEPRRRNRRGPTWTRDHPDTGHILAHLQACATSRPQATPNRAVFIASAAGQTLQARWGESKLRHAWGQTVQRYTQFRQTGGGM